MLIAFDGITPQVHREAYVHSTASLIGDVHVGAGSSIWFHSVLRGDVHHIRIGARTSIQDNSTLHVTAGRHPTLVGDDVTVGHNVVLHGCTVGDRCLIGIGAIVLDRCAIGDDCLIAAGSLVPPGTVVAAGQMVMGSPAKVIRPVTDAEREHLRQSAANYVAHAARYRAQGIA